MKKITSLFLVATIMLTLIPVSTYADLEKSIVIENNTSSSSDKSGEIIICLMLADQANNIATSSSSLPAGSLTVYLGDFFSKTWDSSTFAPNQNIILNENDADCVTISNLDEGGSYHYSEATTDGSSWNIPLYNDNLIGEIQSTSDFFPYNTDVGNATFPTANSNSIINLSLTAGKRTFVIYNTYNKTISITPSPVTPPITPPNPPSSNPPSNSSSGGGSGSGGGGGIGGHRHDISSIISTGGQVLGATTECSYLRDYLRRDWNNDHIEVLKVQSFINVFEKENITLTGVYDQSTFEAVSRFQNKYSEDILTPWGYTQPTGFVYILTKKKINEIYCKTSLALTDVQKGEINTFKTYLASLKVTGANNIATPSIINLSDYVGINTNGSKDGENSSTTTGGIIKNNSLKNLAVSLFSMPKGLSSVSSTYLFIILVTVLIIAYAVSNGFNKKPKNKLDKFSNELSDVKDVKEKVKEKSEPEARPQDWALNIEEENTKEETINLDDNLPPTTPNQGFKGIIG